MLESGPVRVPAVRALPPGRSRPGRRCGHGLLYRHLLRPRLGPPTELEDPRPPRFAQLVGLLVTGTGLVLALAGVPWAVEAGAGFGLVAAFLNAAFGRCLGCELYLLIRRPGLSA